MGGADGKEGNGGKQYLVICVLTGCSKELDFEVGSLLKEWSCS